MSTVTIPTYPAIRFLVGHGKWLASALALIVLLLGVYGGMTSSPIFYVLGIGGALITGAVVIVLTEVLTIIAETLMPR